MSSRFLGITVLGDYILSEGVEAVLDNVMAAGATAVACNPTVTAAAAEGEGSFQPPIDAGSSPRVFDRPLFGKTSLWVRSGVSYRPRTEFYADSPYGPRTPNDLTEAHGDVIKAFVDGAIARGLDVYFQLGAAQPSGLRDEDRPRLPNGEVPPNRLADTASLASEAVRAYNRACVRDLLAEYPNVTGFRPDWPEYPCYTLGECFQDFSPHVERWATARGFDFETTQAKAGELWDWLHGSVTRGLFPGQIDEPIHGQMPDVEGWQLLLKLKSALSTDILKHWREAIDEAGGRDTVLSANAFMTPFSIATGFEANVESDAERLPGLAHCDAFAPKLYTMHWSQIVDFWGREIVESNPGLHGEERGIVRMIVNLLDIDDDRPTTHDRLADWGYPAPDEPHPIPDGPQRRKLARMKALCPPGKSLHPLVHGYGPPHDFERRLRLVAESDADGVWINRYGYLGDEKLRVIREVAGDVG